MKRYAHCKICKTGKFRISEDGDSIQIECDCCEDIINLISSDSIHDIFEYSTF